MTDRDNSSDGSSEGFLERWSRKKVEAERQAPGTPAEPAVNESSPPYGEIASERHQAVGVPGAATPKPEFDLTSLPSLDSITATTDIRAFLGPGVPQQIARAALRRAWTADPAIRDFKGLAENDWNFTDPTAMPGFSDLPPGYDIGKLVAQIFGEGEKPAPPEAPASQPIVAQDERIQGEFAPPASVTEAASPSGSEEKSDSPNTSAGEQQIAQADLVQRNNDIATHNKSSSNGADEPSNRRQHGGALPQ